MLAPLGYLVVEADSGRAALRAVLRQTFAVILMDVRMPTLDGFETARLIRQRSQSEHTPCIFVTAFGQDEIETAAAYESGAVDFVFTPVDPNVLRAKVSAFADLFVQAQSCRPPSTRSPPSTRRCETARCARGRCCRTSPTGS